MSIEIHIFDQGHAFGHMRGTIDLTARRAAEDTALRSGLDHVDVAIHPCDGGDDLSDATATALGPHNLHVGIALSRLAGYDVQTAFYRLMVQKLHQCLRWRHVTRWTLAEGVAWDGLALLAGEALAGPPPQPVPLPSDPQAAFSVLRKKGHKKLEKHRSWLSEPDVPGAPGRALTIGRYVMQQALDHLKLDPFQAANVSADRLLQAALTSPERTPE